MHQQPATRTLISAFLLGVTIASGACLGDADEDPVAAEGEAEEEGEEGEVFEEPDGGGLRLVISRQATVNTVRDVARARGITNGTLIAGIANAETNLTHCRADYYTQQCAQTVGTPKSPSCDGGSVLVGNADSSCAQGGLGMFQIDYGTQTQTIAHYGKKVLSLSGNIGLGIDHILNDLWMCSLTPKWGSDRTVALQRAVTWLNGARRGTADYNTFFMCMSRHYNGAGTQAQANYYKSKTEDVFNQYGSGNTTPPPPTPTGSAPGRVNTAGVALTIRSGASSTSTAVGTVADGTNVTIRCQKRGESITGTYGTSNLWDKIGTGYISDAYVATSSDGQVAASCP